MFNSRYKLKKQEGEVHVGKLKQRQRFNPTFTTGIHLNRLVDKREARQPIHFGGAF